MDRDEVEELNTDLAKFTSDVFAYLPHRGQRTHGVQYLRRRLLDGKRNSVEPLAERSGVPWQNLGHFVAQSPWDYREVMRRVAVRVVRPAT
ncbi:transposase [Streptomyces sp. NPDC048278]|uniref:transposase n=1 Tax=unclassified Streptomyces TaxID=2593676 RepID=UPI00343D520F